METVCQPSYPLNSENASPFGTRTVYLAWPASCAETALPPRTASTETPSATTTITTAWRPLLFISTPLLCWSSMTHAHAVAERFDANAAVVFTRYCHNLNRTTQSDFGTSGSR